MQTDECGYDRYQRRRTSVYVLSEDFFIFDIFTAVDLLIRSLLSSVLCPPKERKEARSKVIFPSLAAVVYVVW